MVCENMDWIAHGASAPGLSSLLFASWGALKAQLTRNTAPIALTRRNGDPAKGGASTSQAQSFFEPSASLKAFLMRDKGGSSAGSSTVKSEEDALFRWAFGDTVFGWVSVG